jgi:hypothetical protein
MIFAEIEQLQRGATQRDGALVVGHMVGNDDVRGL